VEALNKRLQRKCNGRSPAWDGWDMRVGDKIICTLNGNYWHEDGIRIQNIPARTYVANGEQGIVEEIRDTHLIARMSCPRRLVRFYRNDPIQLSWAITCHKSQGSEWPITIVVFDPAANFGLGVAEWVTTGISRAKRFCICVGTVGTARRWVKKTSLFNRKTFLRERMRDV
jgi:exodeoxyribonuclease V alpha subunit